MKYFFHKAIKPFIQKNRFPGICEIGASLGENTALLAGINNTRITVIDPCLDKDLVQEFGKLSNVTAHKGKSLGVLPALESNFDSILIDGDHNWFTVYNELRLIEEKKLLKKGGAIFLHDVRWPYARRDMYYTPLDIPAEYRHPYAKKGIMRGKSGLSESGGMNAGHYNATHEGGPRNGVLTAIEDFLKNYGHRYYFFCYNRGEGLGVLIKKKNIGTFFIFLEWFLKLKLRFYERKESILKRFPRRDKGFSLVEIMIVVAIIGILGAIAIPGYQTARDKGREGACAANIRQLEGALGTAVALDPSVSTEDLSAAEIEIVTVPSYLRSMPSCALGDYSTDENGNVECSYHQ
ncbi:MAG: class I SAM-dependent methyltransferase [Candidatus Omnitrophica bacterium]|nr:class I SAM-dependent methyltransferase [Candidatus Omnitrophota bacterium]